jgi:hypothetical protein
MLRKTASLCGYPQGNFTRSRLSGGDGRRGGLLRRAALRATAKTCRNCSFRKRKLDYDSNRRPAATANDE